VSPSYRNDTEVHVISVIFGDHIEIQYVEPTDARDGGRVTQQRVFTVDPEHEQYRSEVDALILAATDLVKELLEDWPHKPPLELVADDDDEDRGMGWANDRVVSDGPAQSG
jgi:hypothetical protein